MLTISVNKIITVFYTSNRLRQSMVNVQIKQGSTRNTSKLRVNTKNAYFLYLSLETIY